MNTKIKYTNESIGKIEIIPDFLPPPSELVYQGKGDTAINLAKELMTIGDSQVQPSQGFPSQSKRKE